jgi:hypothetical protein
LNPSAALQSTVEDFLDSLSQTPGPAQAELINCILRACGCNDSVDADEVMDYDGVVDTLDNFTESLKQARFIWLFVLEIDLNWRDTGKFTHLSLDVQTPSLQTISQVSFRVLGAPNSFIR